MHVYNHKEKIMGYILIFGVVAFFSLLAGLIYWATNIHFTVVLPQFISVKKKDGSVKILSKRRVAFPRMSGRHPEVHNIENTVFTPGDTVTIYLNVLRAYATETTVIMSGLRLEISHSLDAVNGNHAKVSAMHIFYLNKPITEATASVTLQINNGWGKSFHGETNGTKSYWFIETYQATIVEMT